MSTRLTLKWLENRIGNWGIERGGLHVARGSDLDRDVCLGRGRGSDVTVRVYWDVSPACFHPGFGTKVGKNEAILLN